MCKAGRRSRFRASAILSYESEALCEMFSGDRDQIRLFIAGAWRKFGGGQELSALEHLVASVVARHPEYHRNLDSDDAALAAGADAHGDQENPFLHLGLHIALAEQLQADRPAGILRLYRQAVQRFGEPHLAEHRMMDCLGDVLREAHSRNTQPDERSYLACLGRLIEQH